LCRNESQHFKDLQSLVLGPRPLSTLCVSYLVDNYGSFADQLDELPQDVQQQVRIKHKQLEKWRMRARQDGFSDEEEEEEESEEEDENVEQANAPAP
jgi:hypothetical protein